MIDIQAFQNIFKNRDRAGFRATKPYAEEESFLSGFDPSMMFGGDEDRYAVQGGNTSATAPPIERRMMKGAGSADSMPGSEEVPVSGLPPGMTEGDLAERDYRNAVNEPVKKQDLWKDILLKGATVASNMFNPQNQLEVKGWGRAKHDKNVQRAGQRMTQIRGLEDANTARDLQKARVRDYANDERFRRDELQRKELRDIARGEYEEDLLTFKREDADRINVWRNRKLDAEIKGDGIKVKQAQEKIDELRRHNKVTEKQAVTNETGRNARDAADRKEALRKWAVTNKISRARFQADLAAQVASKKITQEQADAALADFPAQ